MTREWTGAVLGVLSWCLIVMAMGVSNAHGFWEWTWTFLFGAVAPVVLLALVADLLATHQRARTSLAAIGP